MHHSQLIPIPESNSMQVNANGLSAQNALVRVNYFDAEYNWIGCDAGGGFNVDKFVLPVVSTIPENAVYYAISANTTDKTIVTVVWDNES